MTAILVASLLYSLCKAELIPFQESNWALSELSNYPRGNLAFKGNIATGSNYGKAFIISKYWNAYPLTIEYTFTVNGIIDPRFLGNIGVVMYHYLPSYPNPNYFMGVSTDNNGNMQLFRIQSIWSGDADYDDVTSSTFQFDTEYTLRIFMETQSQILSTFIEIAGVAQTGWQEISVPGTDATYTVPFLNYQKWIGIRNDNVNITAQSFQVWDGTPQFSTANFLPPDISSTTYTKSPTVSPTIRPTDVPTVSTTLNPTRNPSVSPSDTPSTAPTSDAPTFDPTIEPTHNPTIYPTKLPSANPTEDSNIIPLTSPLGTSSAPLTTLHPTQTVTSVPTNSQSHRPTTSQPSASPQSHLQDGRVMNDTAFNEMEDVNPPESANITDLILVIAGCVCGCLVIVLVLSCIYFHQKLKKVQKSNSNSNPKSSDNMKSSSIARGDIGLPRIISRRDLFQSCDSQSIPQNIISKAKRTEHDHTTNPRNIQHDIDEIESWLSNIVGLPQYLDNFINNGYDQMSMILSINNENELIDIDIVITEHCGIILDAIGEYLHGHSGDIVIRSLPRMTTPGEKGEIVTQHAGMYSGDIEIIAEDETLGNR